MGVGRVRGGKSLDELRARRLCIVAVKHVCAHEPVARRMIGAGWLRGMVVLAAVVWTATSGTRAAHADLSAADKTALAELALGWALNGGISDTKLMKDPAKVIVDAQNLPQKVKLTLPKRTVIVTTMMHIQVEADVYGDFLYFHFGSMTGDADHASVPITLVWAVGVRSKTAYLSGGGTTLRFERRDGKWTLLPVTERWMS